MVVAVPGTGDLRASGRIASDNGHSSGSVHFMQPLRHWDVVSQGRFVATLLPYLPAEHADIMEFLDIGTEGNPIQKLTHGVNG